jgi:hypothetical protein
MHPRAIAFLMPTKRSLAANYAKKKADSPETARNNPDAKTAKKENAVSLLFSRNLLFLCRLPVL